MDNKDGENRSFTCTNKWTYVPGKVFPLTPLNIREIRNQLLENTEDGDSDIEYEENEDDDDKHTEYQENLENRCINTIISQHSEEEMESESFQKRDEFLNSYEQDKHPDIEIKQTRNHVLPLTEKNITENVKRHFKNSNYRVPLESVPEDTMKYTDPSTNSQECENKENTSIALEPLNLSKDKKYTEDSFDLDLSALSLHTPLKRKERNFNYITPKINIIPPSESKNVSLFKTPNISKNPFGVKKIFTPVNKITTAPYCSGKKHYRTPFQSTKKSYNSQLGEKGISEIQNGLAPIALYPKVDEFERISVNDIEYVVMNLLGKGGSSEVFHCFNPEEKLHVAIKVVSVSDPTTAEGYINEVKLLESLQDCDKIIKLHDYEIRDEKLILVLENGSEDLSTILKDLSRKQSHLPLYILLYYWMEMLYAVKQIHSNGVIHSDLKPANFLRINSGLKLIDFGIASKVQDDMTCVYKMKQEGSCNYISPEALGVQNNRNVNSPSFGKPKVKIHYKSDVWSLGCILYQLVYRKTPFQHLNPLWTKLAAITNPDHKIEYPRADWVPIRIVDTIKRCLQHDIKARPSVEELLEEYEKIFTL